MNGVARHSEVDHVGCVMNLTRIPEQVVSAVIEVLKLRDLNRWMPLIGLAVLTGCGDAGPVPVQPLAATVLPARGDAIVVLHVPGVS